MYTNKNNNNNDGNDDDDDDDQDGIITFIVYAARIREKSGRLISIPQIQ